MFSLWPNARSQFSVHFVFSMQIVVLDLHICIQKKSSFRFFLNYQKAQKKGRGTIPNRILHTKSKSGS